MSDCDYLPRVRGTGWKTLDHLVGAKTDARALHTCMPAMQLAPETF